MSREADLATQEKLAEATDNGQLDQLDDVFAADVIDHDTAPDQDAGPAGLLEHVGVCRNVGFEDARWWDVGW